ncbi:MAG: YcgN family cysteine cluster protein [Planctomycetes bacterium]|nr:YcgN family cysteine cluster protein [Planctomycetota bacterium]
MSAENEQEKKCRKCGRCCCAKLIIEDEATGQDEVVYTPFPCTYLDEKTRLCTVYDTRHQVNPDCLKLNEGIEIGVFPADCPYVADLEDYRPPRENWTQNDLDLYAQAGQDEENDEL